MLCKLRSHLSLLLQVSHRWYKPLYFQSLGKQSQGVMNAATISPETCQVSCPQGWPHTAALQHAGDKAVSPGHVTAIPEHLLAHRGPGWRRRSYSPKLLHQLLDGTIQSNHTAPLKTGSSFPQLCSCKPQHLGRYLGPDALWLSIQY